MIYHHQVIKSFYQIIQRRREMQKTILKKQGKWFHREIVMEATAVEIAMEEVVN